MKIPILLLILLPLVSSSCAYSVHQHTMGGFSPYASLKKGKLVTANIKQKVIFADFSDLEIVEACYNKLLSACPNGQIVSVSTRYHTALGFFSWDNKLTMQGLCLP